MPKKHIGFLLLLAALLAGIAVLTWPRPALAQCGSSASSCKTCHEVQKQDSINAKGEWHTGHAFGDFCEFCHAGNVKAKDKAAAHIGMIAPLGDVKGSCQSCHPNDYVDRANKYASVLGKPIGSTSAPAAAAPIAAVNATTSTTTCGPAAPAGGQTIDLNLIYSGTASAPPSNLGNVILIGLIAAIAFVLLGLVFYYEHPLERGVAAFRQLLAAPALASVLAAAPGGIAMGLSQPVVAASRPELDALLPLLSSTDPATLRALSQLLSDRANSSKILKALSHVDLNVLAELGESDQKVLAALLTLAKEMKS